MEDEDEFDHTPEEGDWVTGDHITFTQYNYPKAWQRRLVVPDGKRWEDVLAARMKEEGLFPNVWFISDHGNPHLLTDWNVAPMDDASHIKR